MLVGMLRSVAQQLLQMLSLAPRKNMHTFSVCAIKQTCIIVKLLQQGFAQVVLTDRLSQVRYHSLLHQSYPLFLCVLFVSICPKKKFHSRVVKWQLSVPTKGFLTTGPTEVCHQRSVTTKLS